MTSQDEYSFNRQNIEFCWINALVSAKAKYTPNLKLLLLWNISIYSAGKIWEHILKKKDHSYSPFAGKKINDNINSNECSKKNITFQMQGFCNLDTYNPHRR